MDKVTPDEILGSFGVEEVPLMDLPENLENITEQSVHDAFEYLEMYDSGAMQLMRDMINNLAVYLVADLDRIDEKQTMEEIAKKSLVLHAKRKILRSMYFTIEDLKRRAEKIITHVKEKS